MNCGRKVMQATALPTADVQQSLLCVLNCRIIGKQTQLAMAAAPLSQKANYSTYLVE